MARPVNRKRSVKKPGERTGSFLWGSLFRPEGKTEEEDSLSIAPVYGTDEDEDEELPPRGPFALLRHLWGKFNFWSTVAVSLFLSFTAVLVFILLQLWMPQDLSDIDGYGDTMPARDLEAVIRNANGGPVTITEAEINRYLRQTCRMRQPGIFSIITHCQGVAVRLHNGYAEIIFDRVLGANMHQTTAVYLTFSQELKLGIPELHADLQGGAPLLGAMPNGGSIGSIGLPRHHVLLLRPALDSLLSCYPAIEELIREHHYCPVITAHGKDRRITLIPYSAS